MQRISNIGITRAGKLKLGEIARGIRQNLQLTSVKVSDRRILIGEIVNYIDSNLEGNVVETIPLLLTCQSIEDQPMITFVTYLDGAMIPYPSYVPQSFGVYDSDGDMIFCSNLSISNFTSRFIVGRIDLVNVTNDIVSKIIGTGVYNNYLTASRIFQLVTTPVDSQEENKLYVIRSLDGRINKVGVRLGNEVNYLGFDEVSGCFVTM